MTTTMADFSQPAKDSSTSPPPSTGNSIFQHQQSSKQYSPINPQKKDEAEMEYEEESSVSSPPALVPDVADVPSRCSSSSSSSSPTLPVLSDVYNKNPLWVSSTSASSTLANTITYGGLGGVPSLSGINTSTPASISLPCSLGLRNVLFQSTPATSSVMGSNKNITVRVPMMYQLTTHPGVKQPLLAPILTMVPPVPSVTSLVNPLMTTPTTSSIVQSLIGSKVGVPNKSFVLESMPDSAFAEIGKVKDTTTDTIQKRAAEPATGQTFLYSDATQMGSSCCSPSSSMPGLPVPRTLASIPPSELTPEQVELKAFAEDFKTRRIKLGFTQGSVGQSLAEKGYSNFAQSTISRFEQMQLSPTNAATIRVVLEQWLIEAECPEVASSSSSCTGSISLMASRKRKKRAVFAPQTRSTLDTFFCKNPRPNRQAIEEISQQLDLLPEEVRVWFCNKRQKSKPGTMSPIRSLSLGHESSLSSATSSNTPSPSPSFDGVLGVQQQLLKRRSVSPPRMPFTIEELSKSSIGYTSTITSSPIRLMSPSSMASDGRSKMVPMIFGQHLPMLTNPLFSPFTMANHVAKTKA